uniref:C-type lectin domain-containing protein n=1 Tax=Stegastes partitus TaxID=144197 RepID=A0A3B5B9A5_9TELE
WMATELPRKVLCLPSRLWSFSHMLCLSSISATDHTGPKKYVSSDTTLTWKDAQAYCRKHYTDLAMIENDQEDKQVMSLASYTSKTNVWIGLYREPWRWSDNSSSSFRRWAYGEPNNRYDQHCAAETSDHFWNDEGCSEKRTFLCHRDLI